jgi:2-desacetyl-2-hydroxyethyl bacteriochlorophyllide A dehydrogenase
MRAARLVAPRRWEIVDTPEPQAAPGRMLVRLQRSAVCGTDRPFYEGVGVSYPLSLGDPGHEAMGVVESCPSGEYQKGDLVLLWGFDRGLYQEYTLAPTRGCIHLPADLEPEVALMSQVLGTVVHCFYKLGNLIGEKAVVLGQGAVGLLFDAVLRNLGASQIIAVDPLAYRLEVGRRMGATHVVDPSRQDVEAVVREITGGDMADLVVEAVGRESTLNQCSRLVRRGGSAVYFGVPNKENPEGLMSLRFMEMFTREVRLITSVGPDPFRDYAVALDWIAQGRLDVRPLITHVLPFAQIQEGFAMAFDEPEKHRTVKVVLTFG